jgi:indole-3-glycerol phosphate synthase
MLERELKSRPPIRSFRDALDRPGSLRLIAEFKRASPSAGIIRAGADPVETALLYEKTGAAAVSVLTDRQFFSGSIDDLKAVRAKINLPVLRKEFIIDEYQIVEAAAAGADAVLLIVAALDQPLLKRLHRLALDLGLDPLVEVHDEDELDRALEIGSRLIGVNNRNLATLKTDLKTTQRLIHKIVGNILKVSESGIHSRTDAQFAHDAGAQAILVGESILSAPDMAAKIRELLDVG